MGTAYASRLLEAGNRQKAEPSASPSFPVTRQWWGTLGLIVGFLVALSAVVPIVSVLWTLLLLSPGAFPWVAWRLAKSDTAARLRWAGIVGCILGFAIFVLLFSDADLDDNRGWGGVAMVLLGHVAVAATGMTLASRGRPWGWGVNAAAAGSLLTHAFLMSSWTVLVTGWILLALAVAVPLHRPTRVVWVLLAAVPVLALDPLFPDGLAQKIGEGVAFTAYAALSLWADRNDPFQGVRRRVAALLIRRPDSGPGISPPSPA